MDKRILATLAIFSLAIVVAPVSAQSLSGSLSGYVSRRLSKLSEALDLSFLQKARICPILIQAYHQSQAIKADTSLAADVRSAKKRELIRTTRQQVEAILTSEQRDKLKAMRQARQSRIHPAPRHLPNSAHPVSAHPTSLH